MICSHVLSGSMRLQGSPKRPRSHLPIHTKHSFSLRLLVAYRRDSCFQKLCHHRYVGKQRFSPETATHSFSSETHQLTNSPTHIFQKLLVFFVGNQEIIRNSISHPLQETYEANEEPYAPVFECSTCALAPY